MKLDAYVYIHVIYNTRGSSLDHRSRCEKIHNALDSGIYNEDNLYAIRREAIP